MYLWKQSMVVHYIKKLKKDGKQPYFKLKHQPVQHPKQAKQLEQIPVRDTGLVSIQ